MGIKITGLDEFRRKLETLQRRAQNVSGPVPFDELFPPEFMRRYTDFKSIEEMLGSFTTPIESVDDLKQIPDAEWDTVRGPANEVQDLGGHAGESRRRVHRTSSEHRESVGGSLNPVASEDGINGEACVH